MKTSTVDAAWKQRDKKGQVEKAMAACEAALEEQDDDFDALWRMARAHWWQADSSGDPARKAKAGRAGMEFGERAARKEPGRVEGHFWYTACIGEYALGISIVKALLEGLDGTFRKHGERSRELDESFEGGAPHRALGRYYSQLPWPKRDLRRSEKHLRKALELGPKRVMNHWFLGETLAALHNDEEAEDALTKAVKMKSPDPDEKPDSPRYRKAAQEALESL